ncbi:hypothetical protein ISF_01833 [Cordyceps fumosorosea ARSEF 2679]|uniref:Uncharacterized protein n=1 Tax=Cordyceps fumosorosea (strain ARSEF 2679) TaxID=1081104 RepID=A0A162JN06_CORFA|nr:hypothetical protein ISF_01833 [Cordyceps fumosorosea ARSEF 2679]OAA71282.1 hypothetical protein ISF_01833 [Cordyceps fumosorosea ARSEF 2679]
MLPLELECADQASDLWHFGETLPADSWCCDRTHFGVAVFNSQGTFLAAACAPSDRPLAPVTAGYFQAKATRPSWGCTGALATNLPTPTATGSPSPTASTSTQQRASTLGKGGVAGIVVGCVAGVVLVGVASWFVLLFRRTRRGAERMVGGAAQGQDAADGPGRGDATPGSYRRPLVELGTTPQQVPAHEMGT